MYPQPSGKEVPGLTVSVDAAAAGMDANAVINALQKGEPPICVFEKSADAGEITFFPEALRTGEAAIVARRLREVLEGAKKAATAPKTPVATRPG
jgi:seryl-tRNA(Sec) selenium transferase